MPMACTPSAATSSVGRDQMRPSHAHKAAAGTAARPASTHAKLPAQAGPVWSMAATRNVPAMM
jgi:hypothetical protein